MTEPAPPPYTPRLFVCRTCGRTFAPPADEAEALAELERVFGLDAALCSAVCEECAGRSVS